MDMTRLIVMSHDDSFLFEIAPNEVTGRVRTEEINGEHSLEITTTRVLEREQRILTVDGTGKWREYVVMREDAEHAAGTKPTGTYWCPWSLMHDLAVTRVSKMPGTSSPVLAAKALEDALSGTERWQVGTVTQTTRGGASMYETSGYAALGTVVEVWGGELDATIEVSPLYAVTARKVDLLAAQGRHDAVRRFDYARDMRGIKRRVSEAPVACRIAPRGKGEATEGGGYGRKVTIESVNGGLDYLQNDETAPLLRLPDGSGGWEYPTVFVENSNIDSPQALKDWALSVIDQYTVPKVTYEADVVQLAPAGLDAHGLALGDAVQCVDRAFSEDGLRVGGRVTKLVTNELDESDVKVTVGYLEEGIAGSLSGIAGELSAVKVLAESTASATAEYLDNLLDRLNAEINANGGYTYILNDSGGGIRTYDKVVSDPETGLDADEVVEIKGGSVRIANSKLNGDWDWKTVFVSGHILADLVTAAKITTGYIGSAGSTYINLDQNIVNLGNENGRHVVIDDDGLDLYYSPYEDGAIAHLGYGDTINSSGVIEQRPFYSFPDRKSGSAKGYYSFSHGGGFSYNGSTIIDLHGTASGAHSFIGASYGAVASGDWSAAFNGGNASGPWSFAANDATASAQYAAAFNFATASGYGAFASSMGTASGSYAVAFGRNNEANRNSSASGYSSFALAGGLAEANKSIAIGGRATGVGAIAISPNGTSSLALSSGSGSIAFGVGAEATQANSIALGNSAKATGDYALSIGSDAKANASYAYSLGYGAEVTSGSYYAYALGYGASADGVSAYAIGRDADASADNAVAIGRNATANSSFLVAINNNSTSSGSYSLIVGNTSASSSADLIRVSTNSTAWSAYGWNVSSDRRIKEHISYLSDDACEFVRKLKPALFAREGTRHLGFYAQDVEEADTWDTALVDEGEYDESWGFNVKSLDYEGLIAPLVAYAQSLESRIEELERKVSRIDELERKIAALCGE